MNRNILKAAVVAVLALPCAASAAVDYFLKIDGIEGESVDKDHPREIEIASWSVATATQDRGSRARPCLSSISFTKPLDKATPKLLANAVLGTVMPQAILVGRKAGEGQKDYLVVVLKEAMVSSYQGGGTDDSPTESISLTFSSMEVEYRPQGPNGTLGAPVVAVLKGGC